MSTERVVRSFTDETGKRHYAEGKTEAEAQEKLEKKRRAVDRGLVGHSGKMEVSKWAAEWLKVYVAPKVREPGAAKRRGSMTKKSYLMYEEKLKGHILPEIGKMRIGKVTETDLQRVMNLQAGKSDSHAKKVMLVIKGMFRKAYRVGVIERDPSEEISMPNTSIGRRRSLTEYERKVMLEVASGHPSGLWIKFLLATGLRPSESAVLRVYDIDLDSCVVKVYKTIEGGTYRIESPTKTAAGERVVPIPDSIMPELREHLKWKQSDAYVFTQKDGKSMMTSTVIRKNWVSFLRQVDLAMGAEHNSRGHIYDPKDILPNGKPKYPDPSDPSKPRNGHKVAPDLVLYCLRHTYCTDLQRAGVPINVAKYLMGHSDISVTAAIYTHTGDFEVQQARSLLNEKNA